jgi:RimJ/RimL family protein N-acetyltransferase
MHKGIQAGRVFIVAQQPTDVTDPDASITVELNQASRGRGIGTVAFRTASELSGYPKVYAAMRKGNVASHIAATRAGFVPLEGEPTNELVLVWRRSS